jgi:hypothetical protein
MLYILLCGLFHLNHNLVIRGSKRGLNRYMGTILDEHYATSSKRRLRPPVAWQISKSLIQLYTASYSTLYPSVHAAIPKAYSILGYSEDPVSRNTS